MCLPSRSSSWQPFTREKYTVILSSVYGNTSFKRISSTNRKQVLAFEFSEKLCLLKRLLLVQFRYIRFQIIRKLYEIVFVSKKRIKRLYIMSVPYSRNAF